MKKFTNLVLIITTLGVMAGTVQAKGIVQDKLSDTSKCTECTECVKRDNYPDTHHSVEAFFKERFKDEDWFKNKDYDVNAKEVSNDSSFKFIPTPEGNFIITTPEGDTVKGFGQIRVRPDQEIVFVKSISEIKADADFRKLRAYTIPATTIKSKTDNTEIKLDDLKLRTLKTYINACTLDPVIDKSIENLIKELIHQNIDLTKPAEYENALHQVNDRISLFSNLYLDFQDGYVSLNTLHPKDKEKIVHYFTPKLIDSESEVLTCEAGFNRLESDFKTNEELRNYFEAFAKNLRESLY